MHYFKNYIITLITSDLEIRYKYAHDRNDKRFNGKSERKALLHYV